MALLGKRNSKEPNVLDVDTSLQGNLIFNDPVNLRINGNFEGKLETKGDLLIGEKAVVRASILGERVTISGQVTGDITALTELRLTASARLTGNVKSPSLSIEKGAIFQGVSRMLLESAVEVNSRVFLSPEEVAHYLSVERALISEWAEHGKLPAEREGESWRFDKEKIDEWVANGRLA